jgi:hypothetical protein
MPKKRCKTCFPSCKAIWKSPKADCETCDGPNFGIHIKLQRKRFLALPLGDWWVEKARTTFGKSLIMPAKHFLMIDHAI